MTASARGSESASQGPPPQPDAAPPPPGSSTQMSLLDQVLRQTALASALHVPSDPATLEALAEVARRLGDEPFGFDPVAVELVHASLTSQLPMLASRDRDWKAVSARIARALFDDPVAHDRLADLWKRLSAGP